jgi:membrane protease YdiL (CAAX protease family)
MTVQSEKNREEEYLPLRAVIPGLILILLVDLLALSKVWPVSGSVNLVLSLVLFLLPWVTLVVTRNSILTLGYHRKQIIRVFGWGMVAGGTWRIVSMLINIWGIHLGEQNLIWISQIFGAIVWVPLVEETFFRGYLGRALAGSIGIWPGILAQALLFTFQPVHLSQGALALASVFGFGVLAGWIQKRFNSIWSAWGAHAFANILPLLVYFT